MKQAVISAVLAIAVVSLLLALPRDHRPGRDRQHPTGETARQDPLGAVDDEAAPAGGPPGGNVFSIAIDPHTPTTVYALAENVVYKSVDGGGSWSGLRRLLGHGLPTITIDPSNTSRVFVLVNGAIVRTSNGGESWQSVEATSERPVASGRLVYAVNALVAPSYQFECGLAGRWRLAAARRASGRGFAALLVSAIATAGDWRSSGRGGSC